MADGAVPLNYEKEFSALEWTIIGDAHRDDRKKFRMDSVSAATAGSRTFRSTMGEDSTRPVRSRSPRQAEVLPD